jgi:hypothetical protein
MADFVATIEGFFSTILENPLYLLLTVGVISLLFIAVVAHRIHKIHSEDIFVHQAWGANWKGR